MESFPKVLQIIRLVNMAKQMKWLKLYNKFLISIINNSQEQLQMTNMIQTKEKLKHLHGKRLLESSILRNCKLIISEERDEAILGRIERIEANMQSLIKKQIQYFENERSSKSEFEGQYSQIREQILAEVNNKLSQIHNKITTIEIQKSLGDPNIEKKYGILFNEVVRLGKEQESHSSMINTLNLNVEGKLRNFSNSASKNEDDIKTLEQLNERSTNLINEYAEKLNKKLESLDTKIKQNEKDSKDQFNDITHLKASVVNQFEIMQNDFGKHIEKIRKENDNKFKDFEGMTMKSINDLKMMVDKTQEVCNESIGEDKIKTMTDIEQLGNQLKSKIEQKDQEIQSLSSAIQANMETSLKLIKKEEKDRAELELNIKSNINKLADQIKTDFGLFDGESRSLSEKMASMIKQEVDARQQTEQDTSDLFLKHIESSTKQITEIKEEMKINADFTKVEIHNKLEDLANNIGRVSHYIDDEINKCGAAAIENIGKLKASTVKVIQHIKDNISKNEENRKQVDDKVFVFCKTLANKQNIMIDRIQENSIQSACKDTINDIVRQIELNSITANISEVVKTTATESASIKTLIAQFNLKQSDLDKLILSQKNTSLSAESKYASLDKQVATFYQELESIRLKDKQFNDDYKAHCQTENAQFEELTNKCGTNETIITTGIDSISKKFQESNELLKKQVEEKNDAISKQINDVKNALDTINKQNEAMNSILENIKSVKDDTSKAISDIKVQVDAVVTSGKEQGSLLQNNIDKLKLSYEDQVKLDASQFKKIQEEADTNKGNSLKEIEEIKKQLEAINVTNKESSSTHKLEYDGVNTSIDQLKSSIGQYKQESSDISKSLSTEVKTLSVEVGTEIIKFKTEIQQKIDEMYTKSKEGELGAQTKSNSLLSEVESLTKSTKANEQSIISLTSEIATKGKIIDELNASIQNINESLKKQENALESKFVSSTQQSANSLTEMNNKILSLEASCDTHTNEITQIKADLAENGGNFKKVNEENVLSISKVSDELKHFAEPLNATNLKVEEQNKKIDSLSSQLNELNTMKNVLESLKTSIATATNDISELKDKVVKSTVNPEEISKINNNLDEHLKKIMKLDDDSEQTSTASKATRAEIDGLSKNVISSIETINDTIKKIKDEMATQSTKISELGKK